MSHTTLEVGLTVRGQGRLLDALTEGMSEVSVPGPVNGPSGVEVRITGLPLQKAFDATTVIDIGLTFAGSVAASYVGSWLFDLARKGRVEKISVNRREVHMELGEITRIIEETRIEERQG